MKDYYFLTKGHINEWPGVDLCIKQKETNELIGKIFLLDIDEAYDYDKKISLILENIEDYKSYDFIKETVTAFIYDLKIEEKYRNKGYGMALKIEAEKILKSYNYKYTSSITNVKNKYSQKINRKLGYVSLKTLYEHDFFFKKI